MKQFFKDKFLDIIIVILLIINILNSSSMCKITIKHNDVDPCALSEAYNEF